jgi:WD40 repeat protein
MPCPGSMQCPGATSICPNITNFWKCERCKENIVYGYDANFYCKCGGAPYESYEMKRCSPFHKPNQYLKFRKDQITNYLPKGNDEKELKKDETGVGKSTSFSGFNGFASGSDDKTINSSTGSLKRTLTGHTSDVNSLAVLKNGYLASGSGDNKIKIWISSTGFLWATLRGHSGSVSSLAVLKSGYLASGSHDKTIKIWDSSELKRTLEGHSSMVGSLAVLQNGDLASGSEYDEIKIWDSSTGSLKRTLTDHTSCVVSLAVLKNGDLASGSSDGTIKIWDFSTGSFVSSSTEKIKSKLKF